MCIWFKYFMIVNKIEDVYFISIIIWLVVIVMLILELFGGKLGFVGVVC